MRATRHTTAVIAVLAFALVGCSASPPSRDAIIPEDMFDIWEVARPDAPRSWVRFDERYFALWTQCGVVAGAWDALGSSVAMSVVSTYAGCFSPEGIETGKWIEATSSFERRPGDAIILRSREGEVLATLTPADQLPAAQGVQSDLLQRPVVTDTARDLFRAPAGFPDQIDKVVDPVGIWLPVGAKPTEAFLVFKPNGEIIGNDGCTQWDRGRFTYTSAGILLTTWFPNASFDECTERIEFERFESMGTLDDSLLLYDAEGQQVAQFERSPSRSVEQ